MQLKTGHNTDLGPCWISWVKFSKTWQSAYRHGKTLQRGRLMFDANFFDVETHEEYWISGPHRDRRDTRFSKISPRSTTTPGTPTTASWPANHSPDGNTASQSADVSGTAPSNVPRLVDRRAVPQARHNRC